MSFVHRRLLLPQSAICINVKITLLPPLHVLAPNVRITSATINDSGGTMPMMAAIAPYDMVGVLHRFAPESALSAMFKSQHSALMQPCRIFAVPAPATSAGATPISVRHIHTR
jgi:hypothetical protein